MLLLGASDAPWMHEVKAILGDDAERVYSACISQARSSQHGEWMAVCTGILSMPDSAAQKWHSDGDHCHDSVIMPCTILLYLSVVVGWLNAVRACCGCACALAVAVAVIM